VLLRSPLGSFFVFVVPLMLLFAINLLNNSLRLPSRGGIRFAEFFTPAMAAFAVVNSCFINVVTSTTHARDVGILKRLRTTPPPPWIYLTARIASAAVVSLFSVAAVFALGVSLFGVEVPWASLAGSALVVLAGILCFCALGFAVTIVIPDADAAVAVAYGSVLPLSFVSDVFLPIDAAPDRLRTAGSVFPVEHLARSLQNLWQPAGSAPPIQWEHLTILLVWATGAFLVALRWFRWEPHATGERRPLLGATTRTRPGLRP
jgi:ABC-2 type transport system permease protein